ncbi:MAG TPA: RidA family protein [Candidatus Binataceae bacterium]|nr:RidA family protein [Candidatus Binataceae bacterium]
MDKKFINPPTLSTPTGYTHVVTIAGGGKLIYLSGQVSLDKTGAIVGKGDFAAQTRQVHDNLLAALAAAGAKPADVVKINTYVVNYRAEHRAMIREVRGPIFGKDNPPASTLVGVQALALDDFLLEVEAVAVVP